MRSLFLLVLALLMIGCGGSGGSKTHVGEVELSKNKDFLLKPGQELILFLEDRDSAEDASDVKSLGSDHFMLKAPAGKLLVCLEETSALVATTVQSQTNSSQTVISEGCTEIASSGENFLLTLDNLSIEDDNFFVVLSYDELRSKEYTLDISIKKAKKIESVEGMGRLKVNTGYRSIEAMFSNYTSSNLTVFQAAIITDSAFINGEEPREGDQLFSYSEATYGAKTDDVNSSVGFNVGFISSGTNYLLHFQLDTSGVLYYSTDPGISVSKVSTGTPNHQEVRVEFTSAL